MTQSEKRLFLIQSLLKERPEYRQVETPRDPEGQRQLLRGLMNVRPPQAVDPDFLRVQDAYLQAETAARGITDLADLTPVQPGLYVWQGDITTLRCDAIVNAANSGMTGCYVPNHRCIDNAIHTYAGVELRLACEKLMEQQGCPGLHPALPVCAAHRGAYRPGPGDPAGPGTAGLLLSLLPGAGGGKRPGKRGLLLHLHGDLPLPQPTGGPDRRENRPGLLGRKHQRKEGDLQCFQRPGQRNLPPAPVPLTGCGRPWRTATP